MNDLENYNIITNFGMVVTDFSIRTLIAGLDLFSETPMYLDYLTWLSATENFYLILTSSKLYITMLCISYG